MRLFRAAGQVSSAVEFILALPALPLKSLQESAYRDEISRIGQS
jgi:hypothetical protein